ncbi:MAG: DUF349 domain-containing protein [Balneolaceae bacterium]
MTDSTKKKTADNAYLFENNFAYVTSEGEVVLRETDYFKERPLTTVDADTVEEQIQAFEKAFDHLANMVDNFFNELPENVESEAAGENFNNLLDEIRNADAIGDFNSLIEDAKTRFGKVKSAAAEPESIPEEETVEEDPAPKAEAAEDSEPEEVKEPVPASEAETETGDEKPDSPEAKEQTQEDEGEEESTEDYYKKLAEKAGELGELTDWAYVTMEFENIDHQWGEGPDPEGVDIKQYRSKIDSLREQFEEKKKTHYEEQKRIRQENLEKKKNLLKKLEDIIENKKWTHTKEVGRIKGQWDNVKPIPAEESETLEASFGKLLTTFDEHKVDRLVKKKQQEEDNLTGKLVILEKMEKFVQGLDDSANWKELENKFNDLTRQFRKIGRIPSEKNQEIWDRYHKAQDTFHSMRFKHDKKYRKEIEKFLSKKKKLIDEAEALIDSDDLADAARQVNKLHRRWKKVGNLPQKDENEMWDRFKEATDAFNDKKADNLDLLRKQEDENYAKKQELIEQAAELKESTDWEQAHKKFQSLMDQWKEIGPVPKRKSGKIWKKFKGTMDYFYDRRRDHFKEVKDERKDNLKEKEEVLSKLRELKDHKDPIEAVEIAKPLQEEFKKAGYVPIKHKNRMWKEYREICDVIYERFRAAKAAVDIVGRENVENFSVDDIADIRSKQNEAGKLRKQISKLNGELIQMKESLSYFKPSGSGSSLLDDVKTKIEKAETDIISKEDKLADLEKEIDMIKKES